MDYKTRETGGTVGGPSAKVWASFALYIAVTAAHFIGSLMIDDWYRNHSRGLSVFTPDAPGLAAQIEAQVETEKCFEAYFEFPCTRIAAIIGPEVPGLEKREFQFLNAMIWGLIAAILTYCGLGLVESVRDKPLRPLGPHAGTTFLGLKWGEVHVDD